jgi:hypothetical protein
MAPRTRLRFSGAGDFACAGALNQLIRKLETLRSQRTPASTRLPTLALAVLRNFEIAGWRRSADRARLHVISLLSGNLTGNFAILRHLETVLAQETAVLQPLITQFPLQINREIISRNREILVGNREFYLQTQTSSLLRMKLPDSCEQRLRIRRTR